MTQEELNVILDKHKKWLRNENVDRCFWRNQKYSHPLDATSQKPKGGAER